MIQSHIRRLIRLSLCLLTLAPCLASAQGSLKAVKSPEGGKIMFGVVDGASSQASGLAYVLKTVHASCRDRPRVGRVFRFRGTDMVGVFFSAVNRTAGNVKVAGLAVAASNRAGRVEAALVSNEASRFASTVNPMLKRLFAKWQPREAAVSSTDTDTRSSRGAFSDAGGHSGPAARLHKVTAADHSASIGIPDGWTLEPRSGRRTLWVNGPNEERIAVNVSNTAADPMNPHQRGIRVRGMISYSYRGNLAREFPALLQAWRRAGGKPPARLQVDEVTPKQAQRGQQCVLARGHMDPDGKGMKKFRDYLCAFNPGASGMYLVSLNQITLPDAVAEREDKTVKAIMESYTINRQVIEQQVGQDSQQISAHEGVLAKQGRQYVGYLNQIGANTTARINASQQAHDVQNQQFEQHENDISRNGQGFSNYLLDQSVVQDNYMDNSGTVGHGTVSNSTADALVKSDPDRYQIVDTPNYWKGIDY